ncbi:MAG: Hint domain-containing protein [Tateyamaria sp.]|uniref:Hint domain-containing protein n=1 Tax=Tateyamaria sp. TaxID=1929288 RepID=UPI0032892C86
MAILIGSGFHLTASLAVAGTAAQGTVLAAADLGQVVDIQTDGTLALGNNAMNVGDSFIVDIDEDGDFTDETATIQTGNDRYVSSTITYADGSTSNVTLELVSLSDGSQAILVNDAAASNINAASDQIETITLGTFNPNFDDRYNQENFNNSITNSVVCFARETLLQTPIGYQEIGTLKVGDEVETAQNGAQKVVWIGTRKLSSADLFASPHLKPVRISAGALGVDLPSTDLLVSPQHRILIASKIAERMFGQREVFVPAIKLIEAEGIDQVTSVAPITYVHILLESHQIVFANGAPAESLHTGPCALQALTVEARKEIFDIFPELESVRKSGSTVRPTVQKQAKVDQLLARHQKNRKKLVLLDAST